MIRVFVYGTLRRGERAHGLLARARFVGEAWTEACWELVDMGAYPGLVLGGATAVAGELWDLPPQLLPDLDAYEGPEYRRLRIRMSDGAEAEAWVMDGRHAEGRPRIADGDWCRRRSGVGG